MTPPNQDNTLALYVHWPWCKKKCPYCDFNSHVFDPNLSTNKVSRVSQNSLQKDYLDALLLDLEHQASISKARFLGSIFFGGGTPSLMPPDFVDKIITASLRFFEHIPNIEITIECNPTSSSLDKFTDFVQAGANRFSIGVQSLQADDLDFLGRQHSATDAIKTIEAAQKACNNINADFIYGLPNQNLDAWMSQLKTAISLGTSHLSAYQLTIEPNTIFNTQVLRKEWAPMPDDGQADFFDATIDTLEDAGFINYEISNFARPDSHCRHNTHIWRYGDYMGLGAGAHGRLHTKDGAHIATRNFKMPHTYIAEMHDHQNAFFEKTYIDETMALEEKVILGLRLKEGVTLSPQNFYPQDTNPDTTTPKLCAKGVKLVERENLVDWSQNTLKLTRKGWPLLDGILQKIL